MLGNGNQQWGFFCSCVHVVVGWLTSRNSTMTHDLLAVTLSSCHCITSAQTSQKPMFPTSPLLLCVNSPATPLLLCVDSFFQKCVLVAIAYPWQSLMAFISQYVCRKNMCMHVAQQNNKFQLDFNIEHEICVAKLYY